MSYMDSYEAFYHGSMLGLFGVSLYKDYIIKSNRETGKGRCELVLDKVEDIIKVVVIFKDKMYIVRSR